MTIIIQTRENDMASVAPARPPSIRQRLRANLAAFAQAAETDSFTYHDERIAHLERRLGRLERAVVVDAGAPAGWMAEFGL